MSVSTEPSPVHLITTTLNRIRAHKPCEEGWERLLVYLGKTKADDEPLPYATIVQSNDLNDALWCCRVEPEHNHIWREFALWCAEQVRHLMEDPRSTDCLNTVRRYLDGQASEIELAAAREAARNAANEAGAVAREAAEAAAKTREAAEEAIEEAAEAAASHAAKAAAREAAGPALAARAVEETTWLARAAVGEAALAAGATKKASEDAKEAAWVAQKEKFLKLVGQPEGDKE